MPNDTKFLTKESEQRQERAARKTGKILLLDGYSTRTLACVRSWGKRGIPFAVGGETRWDMSLLSRHAREKFVYESPKRNVSKFLEDINHYCREFGAECVLPTSEAGIMACSEHRNKLAAVPLIPRECDIATVFSKANTLRLAESIGVGTPKGVHITRETFRDLGSLNLSFPVALKSESSEVMHADRSKTSDKTAYLSSWPALEKECKARLADGQSVLIQEFIDGYGVGVSGLFAAGEPVALIGHRRIRESNPLGGPSALAESIEIDPSLREATVKLFQAVGFTGPAMAEYKIDYRTGKAYLMEINGRFWGTVPLAPAAGLDLPFLYWKMLNGMEVLPEETTYQVGINGRFLIGDVKWLLLCLKGRPQNWPGQFPTRTSAVKSFIGSFFDRNTTELILTADDPAVFAGRVLQELF
jgi:predicted ATP-grasp superfamily ATP-dependent carboligase